MEHERRAHPVARRILLAVLIAIAVLCGGFAWYVSDYYHMDEAALTAMEGDADVQVRELEDGAIAFVPASPKGALIFYPGGKVQPEAYAPLLERCARRDVLCVLLRPRLNLALLDVGRADGIVAQFPQVKTWLIGGHSLGGVAACSYLLAHDTEFDGIVFLASYPTDDLSRLDLKALSVVGSRDHVINWDRFTSSQGLLPPGAQTLRIEGGNHAGFGSYGAQAGDGTASISAEDQQEQTADAIARLVDEATE